MRIRLYLTSVLAVSAVLALTSASFSRASEAGSEQDCSEAGVDYDKSSGKTKDEIIAEMDQALYESLNRYDGCVSQKNNSASSGGGGGEEIRPPQHKTLDIYFRGRLHGRLL